MKKTTRIALIYLEITVVINVLFRIISRNSVEFSEWYAAVVFPVTGGAGARIFSALPFAAAEILLYLLVFSLIAGIIVLIRKLIKGKGKRLKTLFAAFLTVSCAASTLLMMFMFGCEINYNRKTFAEHAGFTPELYSAEDLRGVLEEVLAEIEAIIPYIKTGEHGEFNINKDYLHLTARSSMLAAGRVYPVLYRYYPNPKPVLLSEQLLSRSFIGGIFSPFTMEALYNAKMPDSSLPFTITHELAHTVGFMREDEANFIAFLACRESGDAGFAYSGYLTALNSLLGAYYGEVTPDEFLEVTERIPEQVWTDWAFNNRYWERFRDSRIAQVASAVNDTYLKAQGQSDGVKSYGRWLDLLIADYLARNKNS
jgi:hypothetical protein